MGNDFFFRLNQLDSSYLVLLSIAGLGLLAGALAYTGIVGWVLRGTAFVIRGTIRQGFLLWERLFAWATWPWYLGTVLTLLVVGWAAVGYLPMLTIACALAPLFMGLTTCLAYMFIDQERYEVERGYKAVHNPLKGQELAVHLALYSQQVGVPLLAVAAAGMIGAFALLNQGLYATIGRDWYTVGDVLEGPAYVDFLAYALIHLLRIVDVLNLAGSHHLLEVTYVRGAAWPASALLTSFQTFFTFVLLQQVFASIRQGTLLNETIADFWSPHESIHERARDALPQYGARAIVPLLMSLRTVACLTKEQRDQLPAILAAIGPTAIPALIRHLLDSDEQMRTIAVAALGHLHASDEVPLLIYLANDPSDIVRQHLVEALGRICSASHLRQRRSPVLRLRVRWIRRWLAWRKHLPPAPVLDPIQLAIATLRDALTDNSAAVRIQAARALGSIGAAAAEATSNLIALLKDADEAVRCEAADSLGKVAAGEAAAVPALVELLQDVTPLVKASAARALGVLKTTAAPAVSALVPLLQDQDASVRTTAAEAIAKVGTLTEADTESLVEGLASPDNVVRAQTAQALGTIGAPAQEAASALVEAATDSNDRVRGEAIQALGKIGESAADVAVPSLVRALKDQDNWVSAMAAEALGQMGESAILNGAAPALIRSLRHINPQVRGNAAESLGKMGGASVQARSALERACQDEDGGVRSQAVRALGALGPAKESWPALLTGLLDADPQVRTSAVQAMGQWDEADDAALSALMALLEDANDQVKVQVAEVLPKLAGATPAVIEGLCRRLLEDDSVLVQCQAAQALSKLGPAAAVAGGPLLRTARTAEVTVREQAMRAIAMIQPPEAGAAFASGLQDVDGEIRKMASAGWMKMATIPEEVIPALIDALRDPESQVRANAAHALARLDPLPIAAVPLLIECTADANSGLRINAALALKLATGDAVVEAMEHLIEDANLRIRLIAASSLLSAEPAHALAGAVVTETLSDSTVRLRQSALALVQSLGPAGALFLDTLRLRADLEEDQALREALVLLVGQLDVQVPREPQAPASLDAANALSHSISLENDDKITGQDVNREALPRLES